MSKRVLNVGHCSYDHGRIGAMIEQNFNAEVTAVASCRDALDRLQCGHFDLVLVNRELDVDGSDGVTLIERIKADASRAGIPVMLVSNFSDAQQSAIDVGAEPGFGKAELDHPETLAKLARFLKDASSDS